MVPKSSIRIERPEERSVLPRQRRYRSSWRGEVQGFFRLVSGPLGWSKRYKDSWYLVHRSEQSEQPSLIQLFFCQRQVQGRLRFSFYWILVRKDQERISIGRLSHFAALLFLHHANDATWLPWWLRRQKLANANTKSRSEHCQAWDWLWELTLWSLSSKKFVALQMSACVT